MNRYKSWTLTDVRADVWLDSLAVGNDRLHLPTPHDWSVLKRTLRGGVRDGVDLIEVHNGSLAFSVLPTRGMGLWRGEYHGLTLGWRSPVNGPVHPRHVNPVESNGLGWLTGFDELLCRCGLSSNGPPGDDQGTRLTLHGRIANLPAQFVELRVALDPPYEISVIGEVEEAALFLANLRLTTTYTTVPGSNRVVVHDVVENRGGQPAEMQMLYHCNLGPPFLESGSRVFVPIREMSPLTPRAAESIETHEAFLGPTVGYSEQVYVYDLLADARGHTLALLTNPAADKAVALRFGRQQLPCFTLWKNTAALEDGFVTGLEPGTNYPNLKTFERKNGRVVVLPPGGKWETRLILEVVDSAAAVTALTTEVAQIQAHARARIHRTPQPGFSATV